MSLLGKHTARMTVKKLLSLFRYLRNHGCTEKYPKANINFVTCNYMNHGISKVRAVTAVKYF